MATDKNSSQPKPKPSPKPEVKTLPYGTRDMPNGPRGGVYSTR